jgi:hypothetical protein
MTNFKLQISNYKLQTKELLFVTGIIVFACIFRLIPHPVNFAPITALALFGGAYLDKKYALVIPLIAMFISDIFLGFHSDMLFVYSSFLLIGLLGMRLKSHRNFKNIVMTTIFSSIFFFIITNFGVWLMTDLYPKNTRGLYTRGLLESFILAIPFFKNTIMGDLLFTGVFFAAFEFFRAQLFKKSRAFVEVTQPKD